MNDDCHDNVSHTEKEWEHLKSIRHADGYREGISDGKAAWVQQGFNKGYEVGFASIQHVAELRGKLWGIISMIQTTLPQTNRKQVIEQIQDLISRLGTLEQEIVKDIQFQNLGHSKDTHGDSEMVQEANTNTHKLEQQVTELSKERRQQHHVQLEAIQQSCMEILDHLSLNDKYKAILKSLV